MADERRGDSTPPGSKPPGSTPPLYVSPEAEAIAGEIDGPPPPRWPKVIGIISIVLGALGIVCGGLGIGWQLMAGSLMANIPGGAPPALTTVNPIMLGVGGVSTLWSIVLIVAGAMAVGRKPSARMTHLVWAGLAIVFAGLGMYYQLEMQESVKQWCLDNPDADFAKNQSAGGGIGNMIGLACGSLFGFGWPMFTLVWFGFIKRSPEAIREGVTEQVA